MSTDWQVINRSILNEIDILAEYRAWGLDITDDRPNHAGWLSCRMFGRQDRNPSAGINVGPEHPRRGRYREFAGEGRSLSFFEFAAVADSRFADWKEARNHYAREVGIRLPRGRRARTPEGQFQFREWNDDLIRVWTETKPPIAYWTVRIAGGRLGHHALGHSEQAKEYLAKAIARADRELADTEHPPGWNRKLTVELLRKEAQRLIAQERPAEEPAAEMETELPKAK